MRCALSAAVLLILIPVSGALAQASVVTGQVKNETNQPVAGVPVIVEGQGGNTVVFTDKAGQWTLYGVAPGSYSAKALPTAPAEASAPTGQTEQKSVEFQVQQRSFFERLTSSPGKIELNDALITRGVTAGN